MGNESNESIAIMRLGDIKRHIVNNDCAHILKEKDVYLSSLDTAIQALEKRIPKVPYFISDGYDPEGMEVWDAHCPDCEHELDEEDICPNCGQMIDWENV